MRFYRELVIGNSGPSLAVLIITLARQCNHVFIEEFFRYFRPLAISFDKFGFNHYPPKPGIGASDQRKTPSR